MNEPGELARLAAGVPVATLLPLSLPRTGTSPPRAGFLALACGGIVAAPLLPTGAGWAALIGPPLVVLATLLGSKPLRRTEPRTPTLTPGLPLLLAALLLTAASLLAADPEGTWEACRAAIEDDAAVVVASGALAAVFLGGPFVAWVLSPFAEALAKHSSRSSGNRKPAEEIEVPELRSLENAGTLIGWFERALFFTLLTAGAPEAAAVALTAKSVARFPLLSKHEEGFAEYFLIGTLASLAVAMVAAIAIRGTLGLSPL